MSFHRVYRMSQILESWLLGDAMTHHNSSASFHLQLIDSHKVCPVCCEPCLSGAVCGACRFDPPDYESTQVVAALNGDLSQLIYDFKYHENLAYARVFADLMVEYLDFSNIEALLPVPTHPLRRRQRGYNQAAELAQQLGKKLRMPVLQAVTRIKPTLSQTQLSRAQRQHNLNGAFAVDIDKLECRQSIALIDDVITTGATMQTLARQLKKSMPDIRIQACALAKTIK